MPLLTLSRDACVSGPILNHAARVKSKASAGQVVVSDKTWDACTKQDDYVELDLGTSALKGVEKPIHLFQISKKVSRVAGWTCTSLFRFAIFSAALSLSLYLSPSVCLSPGLPVSPLSLSLSLSLSRVVSLAAMFAQHAQSMHSVVGWPPAVSVLCGRTQIGVTPPEQFRRL